MERGLKVHRATAAQAADLADVAAQTFPLACPPSVGPDDIAAFIAANLSAAKFVDYLADPARHVLAASGDDDRILGYAMVIHGVPQDPDVESAVTARPAVELSKMYVVPDAHGFGVSAALMTHVLRYATEERAASVWLGVNQRNERAQRFYAKHGFTVAGTKTFRLGGHLEQDYVMVRPA